MNKSSNSSTNLTLDLQLAVDNSAQTSVPSLNEFENWVTACLQDQQINDAEITVRIVDETEGQELNNQYRQKNYPTNVLSFPFEAPPGVELPYLGDLVICAPVIQREAEQQNKAINNHWAHMCVHGTLHLLGYDHIDDGEAEEMEQLEVTILGQMGIDDPYQERE